MTEQTSTPIVISHIIAGGFSTRLVATPDHVLIQGDVATFDNCEHVDAVKAYMVMAWEKHIKLRREYGAVN